MKFEGTILMIKARPDRRVYRVLMSDDTCKDMSERTLRSLIMNNPNFISNARLVNGRLDMPLYDAYEDYIVNMQDCEDFESSAIIAPVMRRYKTVEDRVPLFWKTAYFNSYEHGVQYVTSAYLLKLIKNRSSFLSMNMISDVVNKKATPHISLTELLAFAKKKYSQTGSKTVVYGSSGSLSLHDMPKESIPSVEGLMQGIG